MAISNILGSNSLDPAMYVSDEEHPYNNFTPFEVHSVMTIEEFRKLPQERQEEAIEVFKTLPKQRQKDLLKQAIDYKVLDINNPKDKNDIDTAPTRKRADLHARHYNAASDPVINELILEIEQETAQDKYIQVLDSNGKPIIFVPKKDNTATQEKAKTAKTSNTKGDTAQDVEILDDRTDIGADQPEESWWDRNQEWVWWTLGGLTLAALGILAFRDGGWLRNDKTVVSSLTDNTGGGNDGGGNDGSGNDGSGNDGGGNDGGGNDGGGNDGGGNDGGGNDGGGNDGSGNNLGSGIGDWGNRPGDGMGSGTLASAGQALKDLAGISINTSKSNNGK